MPATLKTDIKKVKVWNLTKDGSKIRVATIEQNGRKVVNCDNCNAPCCAGILLPVLNEKELKSNRFKVRFIEAPVWLTAQVPRAQFLAVLNVDPFKGCEYHDKKTHKCTIFPNCPASCLSYDCGMEIRGDVKKCLVQ